MSGLAEPRYNTRNGESFLVRFLVCLFLMFTVSLLASAQGGLETRTNPEQSGTIGDTFSLQLEARGA